MDPAEKKKMENNAVPAVTARKVTSSSSRSMGLTNQVRISKFNIMQDHEPVLSDEQRDELVDYGYTKGFIKCLQGTRKDFALRIWIIDNSLSMKKKDGYKINTNEKNISLEPCTRWDELRDCVYHHIKLSSILQAPTSFRFLNNPGEDVGPQCFSVAQHGAERIEDDVSVAMQTMSKAGPKGITPLTSHINKIYNEIKENERYLRDNGLRVAVIIATDGLPSDNRGRTGPDPSYKFVMSLKRLEGLPVWILIRICTSDDSIVEFYNDLDSELELPIEVLDDYISEAKEISIKNRWLNYGLPLHRIRENGVVLRSLDFLDERSFQLSEVKDFMEVIFGKETMNDAPDPNFEIKDYLKFLKDVAFTKERQTWNPIKNKVQPWVSINKLNGRYNESCSIM